MIDLGYVIGSIVAGLFAVAGVFLAIAGRRKVRAARRKPRDGFSDAAFIGWSMFGFGIAAALIALVFWTGANWPPFDMQYQTWKPVSGTVASVNTRLMSDGHSATQFYVVTLAGDPTAYRCDDSRCSLLTPGKIVHLQCIREWQYAGVPGWACNYDQPS